MGTFTDTRSIVSSVARKQRTYITQVVLWTGLYVVLALAPLAVALAGHTEEYRGFWVKPERFNIA